MCLGVFQQDVDEGNDLQCLAKSHAVCQDAAETSAGLISFQRLDEIVIEEPDSPDLRKEKTKCSRKLNVISEAEKERKKERNNETKERESQGAHLVRFDRSC